MCHTGADTCFGKDHHRDFYTGLKRYIKSRIENNEEKSYTNKIFREGINKVAQKVGEEAVELIIEAKDDNIELFKNEAADLLYHLLILLYTRGTGLEDIEKLLTERHR